MAVQRIAQRGLRDTNFSNLHQWIQESGSCLMKFRGNSCNSCRDLMWFVKIRAIRVYEFDLVRDDSCNSCPANPANWWQLV
jgi:hypothetical protein